MPLALSFLVLWAVSGAVDGVGSGAESVLQGSCFVFAACKSLCNAPGARQPKLVVHLTRGMPSPCLVHPHPDPSVLQQVSERCHGLLQSCPDALLLHEKSYVCVGRRRKSAFLGFSQQVSFSFCGWIFCDWCAITCAFPLCGPAPSGKGRTREGGEATQHPDSTSIPWGGLVSLRRGLR